MQEQIYVIDTTNVKRVTDVAKGRAATILALESRLRENQLVITNLKTRDDIRQFLEGDGDGQITGFSRDYEMVFTIRPVSDSRYL